MSIRADPIGRQRLLPSYSRINEGGEIAKKKRKDVNLNVLANGKFQGASKENKNVE